MKLGLYGRKCPVQHRLVHSAKTELKQMIDAAWLGLESAGGLDDETDQRVTTVMMRLTRG